MSTLSEESRAKAKDKAERLVRADPHARVDASGYAPEGYLDGDVKTGPRPVSRRQFKSGGKVAGETSAPHAGRKPRASGGAALTANSLINRNVKAANGDRDGTKHVGGMKTGGRAHKTMGGLALPAWAPPVARQTGGRTAKMVGGALSPQQRMALQQRATVPAAMPGRPMMRKEGGKVHADAAQDRKLIHSMGCDCGKCGGGRVGKAKGGAINDGTRPVSGRLARKGGGRTKKGTNVNIIIGQPPAPPMPMAGPPPGAAPPGAPIGLRQGVPPPMPAGAAPVMPPPGAMPMARKSGGRTLEKDGGKLATPGRYPIDAGAGGGLGRLEKAERAARG